MVGQKEGRLSRQPWVSWYVCDPPVGRITRVSYPKISLFKLIHQCHTLIKQNCKRWWIYALSSLSLPSWNNAPKISRGLLLIGHLNKGQIRTLPWWWGVSRGHRDTHGWKLNLERGLPVWGYLDLFVLFSPGPHHLMHVNTTCMFSWKKGLHSLSAAIPALVS